MNLSTKLLMLSLPLASAMALASSDGCHNWCGELPNAYFLNPGNDTRGNLGLLLEDLGIVHYAPRALPFHYADFMPQQTSEGPDEQGKLSELASSLGSSADAVAGALQRLAVGHYGRCLSDTPQAVEAFLQEIGNASLPRQDAMLLARERLRFAGLCEKSMEGYLPLQVSESAKPYARYLEAAAAFYAGQLDQALEQFKSLAANSSAWLRGTALYMQGRVALNLAQVRFDGWDNPDPGNIDRGYLDQAAAAFSGYLETYPNGTYAQSAKGLFRKIHWLATDDAALAADYQAWLGTLAAAADKNQSALDFLDETESKVSPVSAPVDSLWPSPALASIRILASWRPREDDAQPEAPAGLESLSSHRGEFAAAHLDALAAYLELAHAFWLKKDHADVIRQTAADGTAADGTAAGPSNAVYSRKVLRGLSLLATGQMQEAEGLWQNMAKTAEHPGRKRQAQWLLALTWNENGRLDAIYARDSPVADPEIQDFFIHRGKPSLLEGLLQRADLPAHAKSLAYFQLVNQWLRHRDFKAAERVLSAYPPTGFSLQRDKLAPLSWTGQPEGYSCPGLRELLGALQKTPDSPHALNCLGDFLRTQDWDTPPPLIADEDIYDDGQHRWRSLAEYGLPFGDKAEDPFGAKTYTSLDYYQEVINRRGKTRPDDLAYALHRATTCFASSGYNHCGDQDIPKEQRAAWFKRLKSEYRNTRWAMAQKYYW